MTRRGPSSPILREALARHRQARADHLAYVEGYVADAERETNGQAVTPEGRARGVAAWDLFVGTGHRSRFRRYASEELRDYVAARPFLTLHAWEESRLGLYLPDPVPL